MPNADLNITAGYRDKLRQTDMWGFVVEATESPRNVNGRLIYEQRFLRRQQLEVIVPFGSLQGPSGSHETGIGDVAAGAKSMLVANLDTGTVLSVAGEVIFPTGNKDKGLGKGAVILEPFVSFAQGQSQAGTNDWLALNDSRRWRRPRRER